MGVLAHAIIIRLATMLLGAITPLKLSTSYTYVGVIRQYLEEVILEDEGKLVIIWKGMGKTPDR